MTPVTDDIVREAPRGGRTQRAAEELGGFVEEEHCISVGAETPETSGTPR